MKGIEIVNLKPCPFCGGTPEIAKHFKENMWQLIHRCKVMPTMVIDWSPSQQRLSDQWNTRHEELKGENERN